MTQPIAHFDIVSRVPKDISMEILLQVSLEDIPSVARVCKRWREFANHEIIWKKHARSYGLEEFGSLNVKELVKDMHVNDKHMISSKKELYSTIQKHFEDKERKPWVTLGFESFEKPDTYFKAHFCLGMNNALFSENFLNEIFRVNDKKTLIGKGEAACAFDGLSSTYTSPHGGFCLTKNIDPELMNFVKTMLGPHNK